MPVSTHLTSNNRIAIGTYTRVIRFSPEVCTMKTALFCLSVGLFVSAVLSQTVKRPEVPAQAVDDNEMNFIIESCRRLIAENDTMTHFVSVPSDCSAFAICEHPALGVIPALMNCPAGMFFDDGPDPNVLTCKRAGSVACLNAVDPCSGKTNGFNPDMVRSQPTQAAYYMCQNQRAMYGGWCELGEQYGSTDVSCVPIPNFVPPETTTAADFVCDLQPMADRPDHFMQAGYEMPCAPGTVFSIADCGCVHNTL